MEKILYIFNLYVKTYKIKYLFLFLTTVISKVLMLLPIYVMGNIINCIVTKNIICLNRNLINMIVIYILVSAINYVESRLRIDLRKKINCDLTIDVHNEILKHKLIDFYKLGEGRLLEIIYSDINTVTELYISIICDMFIYIVTIVVSLYFMFKTSVMLTLIVACGFPISYFISSIVGKTSKKLTLNIKENLETFREEINLQFKYFKLMKALDISKLFKRNYQVLTNKKLENEYKMSLLNIKSNLLYIIISYIIEILIIFIAGIKIINEKLSIGRYVSFNGYTGRLNASVNNLTNIYIQIQSMLVSFDRVLSIIQNNDNINAKIIDKTDIKSIKSEKIRTIELHGVNFKYNETQNIFKDVSLEVNAGNLYAIIGKNGSGKTTLMDIISLILDCQGSIIINRKYTLDEIDKNNYKEKISYMTQIKGILNDKLSNNLFLLMEKNHVPFIDKKFIINFLGSKFNDDNLNEVIHFDSLSGGEKSKICFIRNILPEKDIYLFDEPTSEIDIDSRKRMLSLLKDRAKDSIVMFTTHKKEDLYDADYIVFVNDKGIDVINSVEFFQQLNTNTLGEEFRELLSYLEEGIINEVCC